MTTSLRRRSFAFGFALLSIGRLNLPAATINITTNDDYTRIEGAAPGDEVVIAPGTYSFRVYLTRKAPATNPVIIRALDPAHPPVWDFGATNVENAPGSYTAGDRGRGGWQFSGARNYRVSGIVFRHCHDAACNAGGIRYYNGTTNLFLRNCVFEHNDDGLTGGTQDSAATVEFCEFNANGNPQAAAPTHNLYIYGGYLSLRYCCVHDPIQAQNFHLRCRSAILECNWFARGNSYEGDLMTDADDTGGAFVQTLTLCGNVFVQKASPLNHSQVLALHNDGRRANLTLNLNACYNTVVGNGGSAAFVHLANADHTRMNALIADNIIAGITRASLVEDGRTGAVNGSHNWLARGAAAGPLQDSVQTASPGFRNAAAQDYTLAAGSACIGAAVATAFAAPGREYFRDETTARQWRVRQAARDLGAFESTSTGAGNGASQ